MTFGELRTKFMYQIAVTVSFIDRDGKEMNIYDLDEETMQDTYVAGLHYSGGHLEIMLGR